MLLGERLTTSSPYVWIWTSVVVLMTWIVFHVAMKKKKETQNKTTAVAGNRSGRDDVIIVGAGVAGSALAYALAKDGRRVHVIERELQEPDKMYGAITQPGGRLMLAKLGLKDCLEGIEAQKLNGIVFYRDGKCRNAPYTKDDKFPYEPYARSFRYGRFVQRLRHKASTLPNVNLEEGTVKSLVEEEGVIKGVKYNSKRTGEETMAFAPLTIVCDGAYSNLRGSIHRSKEETHSDFVAFITKNCTLEDPEKMHVIMSKTNITLMYHLSNDEVRCAVEIPPDSIADGEMSMFLKTKIAPQLPPKLRDIYLKGIDEESKIMKITTKSMAATLYDDMKGVIVLGDAFNIRHPICASWTMVILSDVVIICDLLRCMVNFEDAKKLSEVVNSFFELRKPMSAMVNALAGVLRQVLCPSGDEAKEVMSQELFDYLCTSGVMVLFSGMNPKPVSIVLHLFAITLSSIARLLSPFPTPRRIWHSVMLFRFALGILGPHLKDEGVWHMLSPTTASAYRKRFLTATEVVF